MNLKIGIVGLPNAGKSTLFNALLKRQVAFAANFPFATIEPNIGVVPVPDERLKVLADITRIEEKMDKNPPIVPATVEFVDIAGLVKGASEGEGLGNKFLSHIRECHIIVNVVRFFHDEEIVHVNGNIDPIRDEEIIKTELILADLNTLNKQSEPRGVKDKLLQEKWSIIINLRKSLDQGLRVIDVLTDSKDLEIIQDLQLLTAKPVLSVANISEKQATENNWQKENELFKSYLGISAKIESELGALNEEEQKEYLTSLGIVDSGLDRLIKTAYQKLGLLSFLTCGVKEVRAWTIKLGTKAPQAAGVIHTDFEKKFIKADIIKYEDFVSKNGWKAGKSMGLVRSEGKDYEMKNGDIVEFKIGT